MTEEQLAAALAVLQQAGHSEVADTLETVFATNRWARNAAGLPKRKRSKEYDAKRHVDESDELAPILLLRLGVIDKSEAKVRLRKIHGVSMDDRTLNAFIADGLDQVEDLAMSIRGELPSPF